jgi:hypothetical protein
VQNNFKDKIKNLPAEQISEKLGVSLSNAYDWINGRHEPPLYAQRLIINELCETEHAVVKMIRERGNVGREKYGTSMDRRDLHPDEWLQHHQEELCDALQYAERIKGATKLLHDALSIMLTLSDDTT